MVVESGSRAPRLGSAVAYFSMEIALESAIPTYSGGLGVLAGDTLRAAADLGVPIVAVTLLHRGGYFHQHLDDFGNQHESPDPWSPENRLTEMEPRATVVVGGREVELRAWRYTMRGVTGRDVEVYLLDSSLPSNDEADRTLTDRLYGGDSRYRLAQEAVLGLGGIAILRALGYNNLHTYHMNEGHSALLTVALLEERVGRREGGEPTPGDLAFVRQHTVFTTHTPVPAGHDQFPIDLVYEVLGETRARLLEAMGVIEDGVLNMTRLALTYARYTNGVAMRHAQISREMFEGHRVAAITNGIHAATWASPPFAALFDKHLPDWRRDNFTLRYVVGIPLEEIAAAHIEAKRALFGEIERRTGRVLRPDVFTIGFARRAALYKRADLLFSDAERLRRLDGEVGPIQVIYAGKAHPHDEPAKALIRRVFESAEAVRDSVPFVWLDDYDMDLGALLTAGVDIWLNNPERPLEASGTSGMKAALNGVPSLSVLDGWWIEGHVEGATGWAIGLGWGPELDPAEDAHYLYDKLERTVLPLFYQRPRDFTAVRRDSISLNGSFFTAQRMMQQYVSNAYGLAMQ